MYANVAQLGCNNNNENYFAVNNSIIPSQLVLSHDMSFCNAKAEQTYKGYSFSH